ncbi:MAG TPA: hypothetical protein VIJ67_14710 [Pseudolabrys sp.]
MQRIILAAALCLMAGIGQASASDAFKRVEGQWRGKGTIEFSNKTKETLHCRASYDVLQSGAKLQLAIRCASDSYKIDLIGTAIEANGKVTGSWSEATLNVSGSLSGRAEGSSIKVLAASPVFTANFSLVTHGGKQSVSIRSETPDSTIRGASISLARN